MPSKLLHAYRSPPVIADDIILSGEAPAGHPVIDAEGSGDFTATN